MDECTFWELNDLVDNIPYLDRNMMNGFRLNGYITAQVNNKKSLKLQDICEFKWDEEHTSNIEISNEDIERLKKKANEYIQHGTT